MSLSRWYYHYPAQTPVTASQTYRTNISKLIIRASPKQIPTYFSDSSPTVLLASQSAAQLRSKTLLSLWSPFPKRKAPLPLLLSVISPYFFKVCVKPHFLPMLGSSHFQRLWSPLNPRTLHLYHLPSNQLSYFVWSILLSHFTLGSGGVWGRLLLWWWAGWVEWRWELAGNQLVGSRRVNIQGGEGRAEIH